MSVDFDSTVLSLSVSFLSLSENGMFFIPAVWKAPVITAAEPYFSSVSAILRLMYASRSSLCSSDSENSRMDFPYSSAATMNSS